MRALFLCALLCGLTARLSAQNQKLPEVALKDMAGQGVQLSKVTNGKKLYYVTFWATWCAPCKRELETLKDHYANWSKSYDFDIIAVSVDQPRDAAKIKPMVDSKAWPYRFYHDYAGEGQKALNIRSVPYSVWVNGNGEILKVNVGFKPGDEDELKLFIDNYFGK